MPGADADIVVWDPERSKTISAATQQSAIEYNVFEGRKVKGLPRFVLSRGKTVVDSNGVHTVEGSGQFVARKPFQSVSKALSTWKKNNAPQKIERAGIPQTGV